jgi:hypothetical protein
MLRIEADHAAIRFRLRILASWPVMPIAHLIDLTIVSHVVQCASRERNWKTTVHAHTAEEMIRAFRTEISKCIASGFKATGAATTTAHYGLVSNSQSL